MSKIMWVIPVVLIAAGLLRACEDGKDYRKAHAQCIMKCGGAPVYHTSGRCGCIIWQD